MINGTSIKGQLVGESQITSTLAVSNPIRTKEQGFYWLKCGFFAGGLDSTSPVRRITAQEGGLGSPIYAVATPVKPDAFFYLGADQQITLSWIIPFGESAIYSLYYCGDYDK